MPFRRRTFDEILGDMIAHVELNTSLTDYRVGAVIRAILEAAATEDDEAYFQMEQILRDFSYTTARGEGLDRRLADFDLEREGARPSLGAILLRVPEPVAAQVVVPAPVMVYSEQTPLHPRVEFQTTLPAVFLAGATESSPVPVVSTRAGADTNLPAGLIRFLKAPIPGLPGATATNPVSCRGGRDRESDDEYRDRGRRHPQTIARGTIAAIEGTVLGRKALSPDTGDVVGQVSSTFLREDRPGESTLFILDATNRFDQATQAVATPEVLVQAASPGQRHARTRHAPLVPETVIVEIEVPGIAVPLVLRADVSAMSGTSPYWLLHDTNGEILFRTLPTAWAPDPATPPADYSHKDPFGAPAPGLPAGSRVRVTYAHFTGLVAEVQRVVHGDRADRVRYPGVAAAGTRVRVRYPVVREIAIHMAITAAPGYQASDLTAPVGTAVEWYVNGRGLGEELVHARLIDVAMSVPGLHDVKVLLPTGNVDVLENEIARAPRGSVLVVPA